MLKYTVKVTADDNDFDATIQYTDTEQDIDFAVSGEGKIDEALDIMLDMVDEIQDEIEFYESASEIDRLLEGDEDDLMNTILDLYDKKVSLEAKIEELEKQIAENKCSCKKTVEEETPVTDDNPKEDIVNNLMTKYDKILKNFNSINLNIPDKDRYISRLADFVNYYL